MAPAAPPCALTTKTLKNTTFAAIILQFAQQRKQLPQSLFFVPPKFPYLPKNSGWLRVWCTTKRW